MKKDQTSISSHEILSEKKGVRFKFLCDLSGMHVCTSKKYDAETEKEILGSLESAWNNEGKQMFNFCHKCGKWVSDIMFNADVLRCVRCAPWEDTPDYCPLCGEKVMNDNVFCEKCGERLLYGGDADVEGG